MSYSDLLKDPRWQRKRLEVLERADFACEHCGATEMTLHVHHTHYKKGRKPWEYEGSTLLCLCENCHTLLTNYISEIQSLVGANPVIFAAAVVGFTRGLEVVPDPDTPRRIKVESLGIATGIALLCRTSPDRVQEMVAADGSIDGQAIRALRFKTPETPPEEAASGV